MEGKTTRLLTALALFGVLLSAVGVSAQIQGLELSLDRDMISLGDQGQMGQLTCQANGNAVTVKSVTMLWVQVTGESTEVVTVTPSRPADSVSRQGIMGNGTLKNNNAYILLDQMDAALCDSSYFLCEVMYTKPSGESERAIATAWPRQPQSARPGMEGSNHTQGLGPLQKRLEDMSAALEMMNMSFSSLMARRQQEQREQAKILSRIDALENKTSSPSGLRSCDPCSNVSQTLVSLEKRLVDLEMPVTRVCQQPTACERGMSETSCEPFYIITPDNLMQDIRCDAQTDGGGWIVFQRRTGGSVDFNNTWTEYSRGFGDLSTEFWLGNNALYELTSQHQYELRADVRTDQGVELYNTYAYFIVADEMNLYRLTLGPFTGGTLTEAPGSGLSDHNGSPFSTADRDNDAHTGSNCAAQPSIGPFWLNACGLVRPNAASGMMWNDGNQWYSIEFMELKIRRTNQIPP